MIVELHKKGFGLFDKAIEEVERLNHNICRFVVNEQELLDFWYFLNPDKTHISVKYGVTYFKDKVEDKLADQILIGEIKLDYLGISVVFRANA